MKTLCLASLALLSSVAFAAPPAPDSKAAAAPGSPVAAAPAPDSTQSLVARARLVQGMLEDPRYAYRVGPKGSASPDALFNSFIATLDPGRYFVDQQDVEALAPQGRRLAEAVRAGDLQPVLAIFGRFRDGVASHTAAARSILAEPGALDAGKENWAPARGRVPRAADDAALDAVWRQRIANDALELTLAGRKPAEIRELLATVYSRQAERVAAMTERDAVALFLGSYARSVDDGNAYSWPDPTAQPGGLVQVGLGMTLQGSGMFTRIFELVPEGPSAVTGQIHVGDRLLAVGQGDGPLEDMAGLPLDDVVQKLRGEEGSTLRLLLLPVEGPVKTVRITRAQARDRAHASVVQVGGQKLGVIRPESFYSDFEGRRRNEPDYRSVTRDVVRLVEGLKQDGVTGIVLDLRDDDGGALSEVIGLAGVFLGKQPVMQIREADGRVSVEDATEPAAWDGPLAVLVDDRTAAGAEMLAAALQDHGRALVVGTRTFKRGTIQNLFDLGGPPREKQARFGQLKVTIAEVFRVNGRCLHGFGVTPDVALLPEPAPEGTPRRLTALPPRAPRIDTAPLMAAHRARVEADAAFQAWRRRELAERELAANNALSFDPATRRTQTIVADSANDPAVLQETAALLADAVALGQAGVGSR